MADGKRDPDIVPPELLFILVYIWLCFSLLTMPLIFAFFTAAILYVMSANIQIALSLSAVAAIIGMVIFQSLTSWVMVPLTTAWIAYETAFINGLDFETVKSILTEFLYQQIAQFQTWHMSAPLGVLFGSMSYAAFLKIRSGPLGKTKRYEKVIDSQSLEHMKTANTEDGSVIGADRFGKLITLPDNEANEHVLVLGTTGAGKTVTVSNIVESAINRGLPLIYIDGKGDYDLGQKVVNYARGRGRKAWLFGMAGDSVCYDPLATGGYTSKKDRIIELREWTEEHYKKLAEGYLQAVFRVLDEMEIPCDLVSLSKHLDLKKLKTIVRENKAKSSNTEELMELLNDQDQAAKSIDSLISEIKNFTNSEIGHLFKSQEGVKPLTLKDVIEEGGIAYFCLPALAFPSMAQTLGRLVINDLKATVAQNLSQVKKPTLYAVFDEFSVFAGEQVLNVINMGRSAGIHAVLSTQSLSDIAAGRKENADHFINQVVGNCNTFIMHRQNSPDDAETLASIIGTKPSLEYTAQISQQDPTHMGTVRRTRGFLAHPDDIKALGKGEAFYYSKHTNKLTRIKARLSSIFKT